MKKVLKTRLCNFILSPWLYIILESGSMLNTIRDQVFFDRESLVLGLLVRRPLGRQRRCGRVWSRGRTLSGSDSGVFYWDNIAYDESLLWDKIPEVHRSYCEGVEVVGSQRINWSCNFLKRENTSVRSLLYPGTTCYLYSRSPAPPEYQNICVLNFFGFVLWTSWN